MTRLIADGGATSVNWALISPDSVRRFDSQGFNPAIDSPEVIASRLSAIPADARRADTIDFYGAGCLPHTSPVVTDALRALCPNAAIHVSSDLEGAARALFGTAPGIACIIGTGSNSGYYDGSVIRQNTPSLGFILGDEAGGAALGRRFLADLFKGLLPERVKLAFLEASPLTLPELIDHVYRRPSPNAWLASFAPQILSLRTHQAVAELVADEMARFVSRNLMAYPSGLHVGFVGSIAVACRTELTAALQARNLIPGPFLKAPLDSLCTP